MICSERNLHQRTTWLGEDGPFSSDTVTNSYQNRLRTALALQQPSGLWTNGFGYDLAGRLTNVTSQAGSYGYGLAGAGMLVKRLNLPGGGYITNSHDVLARLTGTYLKNSGGTTYRSHEYTYNGAHQRTLQTWADGTTVDYSYDLIGQLKAADSSVYGEDLGYAYDAAWNLNRRTNDGAVGYFHVNVKNELTNALGAALTYDAKGNATGLGGGVTCAYDDENRLIQRLYYQYSWMHATNGDQRTDLVYDGQGRLRKRLEYSIPAIQQGTNPPPDSLTLELGAMGLPSQPNWTLESETWYVYDGKRVIQERNGSNTPQVSYTRGTDLSGSLEGAGGIGGLLARSEGSAHASYFADGNGNITSLSGGNSAVVASYRYDPYGNLLFKSGAWADTNVYRFSSKECHVKSGLYYYLYRWYSPELQRWINRDPIGEVLDHNLYRFDANAPTLCVDRDGRSIFGGILRWWEGLLGKGGCALAMGILSKYSDMPKGGDRYAHCMASCRIEKHCGDDTAATAGFMKEVYDLAVCLATWNQNYCYSAFQQSDFDDNNVGRSCPPEKPCQEQCEDLIGAEERPGGPFQRWPPRLPVVF